MAGAGPPPGFPAGVPPAPPAPVVAPTVPVEPPPPPATTSGGLPTLTADAPPPPPPFTVAPLPAAPTPNRDRTAASLRVEVVDQFRTRDGNTPHERHPGRARPDLSPDATNEPGGRSTCRRPRLPCGRSSRPATGHPMSRSVGP